MRVLVCGGRDYFDAARVCAVLDHYHSQRPFSVVIHGNAPGADRSAGDWATSRGVPVQAFPAEWDLHGRAAGPIRNKQMLDEGQPEIVIAFPGRAGTRNMKDQARGRNVPVLEIVSVSRTIFVFGSNLAGRHGKGAALYARQHHGATYGQGEGLQGDSYAIPTKDAYLRTLPLAEIRKSVDRFIGFAAVAEGMRFQVTRIGCGLAGYTDKQIAPMFASAPDNCVLPDGWRNA